MSSIQNAPKPAYIKNTDTDDIQDDLKSIQKSGASLAQHIKNDAAHMAGSVMTEGQNKLHDLRAFGESRLKAIEKEVIANPVQSVAIALGTGAILSLLLRRR